MVLILVMIVKNESKNIRNCINSALPFIDAICISDTGSSDDTVNIIKEFETVKPTRVFTDKVFKNFGYNRTASMRAAEEFVLEQNWYLNDCHALIMDADSTMNCTISKSDLHNLIKNSSSGNVNYLSGNTSYSRTNFFRFSEQWYCVGYAHEFWTSNISNGVTQNLIGSVSFQELNTGGSRGDKHEREIRLLELEMLEVNHEVIKEEFGMSRRLFYLGRAHFNSKFGDKERARQCLEKCISNTKFPEEAFEARILLVSNDQSQCLKHAFQGLSEIPTRPELLYHAARNLAWKLDLRIGACELLLIAIRNTEPTRNQDIQNSWIECASEVSGCSKETYLSRKGKSILFFQTRIVTFCLFEELAICCTWTDTKNFYIKQGQRCNQFLIDHADIDMRNKALLRKQKYFSETFDIQEKI